MEILFSVRHRCGITKMANCIVMARLAGSYLYLSTPMVLLKQGPHRREQGHEGDMGPVYASKT